MLTTFNKNVLSVLLNKQIYYSCMYLYSTASPHPQAPPVMSDYIHSEIYPCRGVWYVITVIDHLPYYRPSPYWRGFQINELRCWWTKSVTARQRSLLWISITAANSLIFFSLLKCILSCGILHPSISVCNKWCRNQKLISTLWIPVSQAVNWSSQTVPWPLISLMTLISAVHGIGYHFCDQFEGFWLNAAQLCKENVP